MADLEAVNVLLQDTREELREGLRNFEETLVALYTVLTPQEVETIGKRFRLSDNNILMKCIGEAKSILVAKEAAAQVKSDADAKLGWTVVGQKGAGQKKPLPGGEVLGNNLKGDNGPRIHDRSTTKGGGGGMAAQTGASLHNGKSGRRVEESAAARSERERILAMDEDRKYNIIIRGPEETGRREDDRWAVDEILLCLGLGNKI